MPDLLTKPFGPFTLHYRTEREISGLIRDVNNNECHFFSESNTPLIIDAGAHIGVMTLWFKQHYPKSRIICFEPNPDTFSILRQNVISNQLKNVTLVNAALSNRTGYTSLYGVMDDKKADTRGNSIMKAWGSRGQLTQSQKVRTVRLSNYVRSSIDFLKLDVEGAELAVLSELGDKLQHIRSLVLEVHATTRTFNSVKSVQRLLKRHGLQTTSTHHRDLSQSLPAKWKDWVVENHPTLTVLRAINNTALAKQQVQRDAVMNYGDDKMAVSH